MSAITYIVQFRCEVKKANNSQGFLAHLRRRPDFVRVTLCFFATASLDCADLPPITGSRKFAVVAAAAAAAICTLSCARCKTSVKLLPPRTFPVCFRREATALRRMRAGAGRSKFEIFLRVANVLRKST